MPINFLKNIKLSLSPDSRLITEEEVMQKTLKLNNLVEIYLFYCKELNPNQFIFNDGCPSLILMPQKSDIVLLRNEGKTVKLNSAWVCCGEIKNIYWELPHDLEYILVLRFKLSSFYSLFHVSPSIFLSNPIYNLEEIVSGNWIHVFNNMYEKKTLLERISFLEKALCLHQSKDDFPFLLSTAIEYIEFKKGNTTVSDVLNQLGKYINPRWLHRNFIRYIGISPKKYIMLQRFIFTYGNCGGNKPDELFDIALHSGYYDYNHFVKDFKKYLGATPSQYTWG